MQQMTGIGTSSAYCDTELKARGFPYECEKKREKTIVVKTHDTEHCRMFKKIVLLVRNPYDALLSFANFARAGHTGHPSEKVLLEAIDRMFDRSIKKYVHLTRSTITQFKGPIYVLQYEKIKANMSKELRNLATFFNVSVSDQDIDCTVKIQEGNFHRQTSYAQHIGLLRAVYGIDKLSRLQEAARAVEKMIKDAYNIELDLGGDVEETLFESPD